jgi:hypothetical protein
MVIAPERFLLVAGQIDNPLKGQAVHRQHFALHPGRLDAV